MPEWAYPAEPQQPNRFGFRARGINREEALDLLGAEIERIRGFDVQIGVVTPPDNIGISGSMRKQIYWSTGCEVSFMRGDRQLVFHTNAFRDFNANLYAIAKGLEALRMLDRYGVTQTGQQYEGFAQLESGHVVDSERGRVLAEQHGGLKRALRVTHPDQGGSERDFKDVMAYKTAIGA
jgi:hypothetical protein